MLEHLSSKLKARNSVLNSGKRKRKEKNGRWVWWHTSVIQALGGGVRKVISSEPASATATLS